ncbi:MAG: arsenosugar biosynthesis radical SAM protein ArsS [Magnetococcales bacterium]|nr:arsenosugar biosynthesis radical SAM protein ArsS [Magnetococcales bacterium]
MNEFLHTVEKATGCAELRSRSLDTLQVNLGLQCLLECRHCHLGASPRRKEMMSQSVMEQILAWLRSSECRSVDLTGGTPELHPRFRHFITALRARDIQVQVRTNLTVYQEPGMTDLVRFLGEMQVGLVGSLPCYLEKNVDAQRGAGIFQRSIEAIRLLNRYGYGIHPQWPLLLVYNPSGPSLPPDQTTLEATYREVLKSQYDLFFTRLLTITNMPIGRFQAQLRRQGEEGAYMTTLQKAFNPGTLPGLMCRNQISVRWDGRLFDCDFNLALDKPLLTGNPCVKELSPILASRPIATGNHCLACTAGAGSSCSGALLV